MKYLTLLSHLLSHPLSLYFSLNPPPLPPSLAPPTSSPVDLGTFPSHVGSLPVEGSPLSQQRPPRRSTDIIHVARPVSWRYSMLLLVLCFPS